MIERIYEATPSVEQQTRNPYQYAPLNESQIRCLHLKPKGWCESGFRGRLKSRRRHDKGYIALSYEWGDDPGNTKKKLFLTHNGQIGTIPLTDTLWYFLFDLHQCSVEPKTFFIDQISINQRDLDEKAKQVSYMGEIFRNADKVITYLGPEGWDIPEMDAMKLLDRITDHFGAWFDSLTDNRHALSRSARRGDIPRALMAFSQTMSAGDVETLRALEQIVYKSGWTRRLWMAQENILNRNVLFMRGSQLIPQRSIFMLPVCQAFGLLPYPHDIPPELIEQALMVIDAWRDLHLRNQKQSLIRLAYDFGSAMDCQQPHDKVYALLGLAEDSYGIQPIYTDSALHTFSDFVRKAIDQTKTLDVWIGAGSPTSDRQRSTVSEESVWPSWVPTFSKSLSSLIVGDASGTMVPCISFPHNSKSCLAKGWVIAKVDEVIGEFGTLQTVAGSKSAIVMRTYLDMVKRTKEVLEAKGIDCERSSAWKHEFCYAVMADDPKATTHSALKQDKAKARYVFDEIVRIFSKALNSTRALNDLVNEDDRNPRLAMPAAYEDFQARLMSTLNTSQRSLCLTKCGRLALVSQGTQSGDAIVVLAGGGPLFVLRPTDQEPDDIDGDKLKYELVGSAFVRGFMNAQILLKDGWFEDLQQLIAIVLSGGSTGILGVIRYSMQHLIGIMMLGPEELEETDFLGGAEYAREVSSRFVSLDATAQRRVIYKALARGPTSTNISAAWRKKWWELMDVLVEYNLMSPPPWESSWETFWII